ncbi:MAG: hypothetical protein A2167_04455 [Planctomycetes bacterium RBG_13_46_10]|nr:MAG: hypothetical protein A2167_04455 [Planctomycetes bacterium RBG_13_46_10]
MYPKGVNQAKYKPYLTFREGKLALFLAFYKIVDILYSLVTKELILIFTINKLALFCIKSQICRTFSTIVEQYKCLFCRFLSSFSLVFANFIKNSHLS